MISHGNGHRETFDMLLSVLGDAADRGQEVMRTTSPWGYILGVVSGVMSVLWGSLFGYLTILLVMAMATDWFLGRSRAYREGEYVTSRAHQGLLTKASGYGVILILWLLELRAVEELGWASEGGGLISTILLTLFLIDELDSVERNRIRLGASPIPLWTPAIEFFRGAAIRVMPGRISRELEDQPDVDPPEEEGAPPP